MVQLWRAFALLTAVTAVRGDQQDSATLAKQSNESLLWGPYRPNLYFGVRPRIPKSLLMGLLWAKVDDYESAQQSFRHTCEQSDNMGGYGWEEYDARVGGKQTIFDQGNNIDLTTEFVKFPGGQHGGGWGVRIKGVPRANAPEKLYTSVVFYAGLEGQGNVGITNEPDPLGFEGTVTIAGDTPELGSFTVDVTAGPDTNRHPEPQHDSYGSQPLDRTMAGSASAPDGAVWQAKPLLFQQMKKNIDQYIEKYGNENSPPPYQVFTIGNQNIGPGNLHLVQKVFEGAFEFDIIYSSGSAAKPTTSEDVKNAIQRNKMLFADRFAKNLAPKAPFDNGVYNDFAKAMFSNLIGGIGYFHGDAVVDRSDAEEYEEQNEGFDKEAEEARQRAQPRAEGPSELFSSIPSRPFFPRGFYWDEGFHLIPIADWDMDLTLDIVRSWFKLIDEDGWIAREQILGPEARSKVPPEFQVQYPHYANPPTLFMILEIMVDKMRSSDDPSKVNDKTDPFHEIRNAQLRSPKDYLREFYPLLKRHYYWFRKTQWGDIKSYDREAFSTKEAYRWRGRTVRHILTSGLDDYPRAQPPHPGELHVDLMSWMGMMTRSMRRISETLGEEDDVKEFAGYEKAILRNIEDLHWSKTHKTYCDATIDEFEENVHVCHKGYISLFPFLTGLMPHDHKHLKSILDLIEDPEELWSDYGIRSLSKKDEFYGTDENYWRSPIWMNINYLILKNLSNVITASGPHRKQALSIYTRLRKNVVKNVFKQWKKTGFAWEQYNPENGDGQRTQHFTGWTSLVVKIMTMEDLSGGAHDEL